MSKANSEIRVHIRAMIKSSESSRQKRRLSGQDTGLNEASVRPESHSSGTGSHGAAGEAPGRAVRKLAFADVSSRVEVPEEKSPSVSSSGRTSAMTFINNVGYAWTPEIDAKILAAKHGELGAIAKELGVSRPTLSNRRLKLGAIPMRRTVLRRANYSCENQKPKPVLFKPSRVGLPFARPAWFQEDVTALAKGVPPYAASSQNSQPRLGNYRVLS